MSTEPDATDTPEAIASLGGNKAGRPQRGVRGAASRSALAGDDSVEGPAAPRAEKRLKRTRDRKVDQLSVDPKMVPPGVSYEWKRTSVYGMDDSDHLNQLMANHWSPVPEDRHPNFRVKRKGLILMERPSYLTQEAKDEDLDIALGAVESVRSNLTSTPQGTLTRNHPSARNNTYVRSGWGGGIPGDE